MEMPLCTQIICCSCSLFNILHTSCKSSCVPHKLMSSHLKEKSARKLSEEEVVVFLNVFSTYCLCSHSNWVIPRSYLLFLFPHISTSSLFAYDFILDYVSCPCFSRTGFFITPAYFFGHLILETPRIHWEMSGVLLCNSYPLIRLASVALQMCVCVWRMNL